MHKINNTTHITKHNTQPTQKLNLLAFNLKPYQINQINEWLQTLPKSQKPKMLNKLIHQLHKNIPIEYITGYTYFYDLKLIVKHKNCKTYIPSSDTEKIINIVLKQFTKHYVPQNNTQDNIQNNDTQNKHQHKPQNILFLDIGTGSGAIILALYNTVHKQFQESNLQFHFVATDIDPCAIKIAKLNAKKLKAQNILIQQANLIFQNNQPHNNLHILPHNNTTYTKLHISKQVHQKIYQALLQADIIFITFNKPYVLPNQYQKLSPQMHFYPKHALLETQKFLQTYKNFTKWLKTFTHKHPQKTVYYIQETRYSSNKLTPKFLVKKYEKHN